MWHNERAKSPFEQRSFLSYKRSSLIFTILLLLGFPSVGPVDFLVPNVFAKENVQLISKEEFISSDFQKLFKKRAFKEALDVLDGQLKKYPDDLLILRYRALTLDKLNRRGEAIAIYKSILSKDPNHVPTHLFLGLAYARDGKPEEAAKELRWVAEKSSSEDYRHWAQAQLTRVRLMKKNVIKKVQRRSYLIGKTGVYYDSNPLLIPDDSRLSSRSNKDGADFPVDLSVGYPVILEKDIRVDALYVGQALLHDSGASQIDFNSQGFALHAKKRAFM